MSACDPVNRLAAVLFIGALAALGTGTPARATLCDDLRALDGQTQVTLPGTQVAAKCTKSLTLNEEAQLNCVWPFSYRADVARAAFERLIAAIPQCLGDAVHITVDLPVNHPDFYALHTFEFDGQQIAVSLKDKAALAQTYVFLRARLPE